MKYIPRLRQVFNDKTPELQKALGLKSVMQVPKLEKIVINIGEKQATNNIKYLEAAMGDLQKIAGQKPVLTKAKKSIAGFKLRENTPIGTCVTLRQDKMYEFLDRFINIAVPRIRDFRGFSAKAFDGRGNYMVGIKEQIIFPEIEYEKVDQVRGLGVCLVTTAKNDVEAKALFDIFNFPFRK
jgi:large subunit ribosomal protein L5